MSNLQILLAIAAFVILTFGTFIWFVATWDPEKEPALSFFWTEISPPEASTPPEASEYSTNIRGTRKDSA